MQAKAGILALMYIQNNVALGAYSTMRLGGTAKHLVEIHSKEELVEAITWADAQQLPAITIGIGSNIVWTDNGYSGLVIVNRIPGYHVFDEDEENTYVKVGAGVSWDGVVERTVGEGLSGIEALSLIPGTAGATPVQNVGAYGQEISDTLVNVEAYDREQHKFVTIPAAECGFGYRTSRFKTFDKNRFFISSLTLHLTRQKPLPPFYRSIQAYLDTRGITDYTAERVREAVITVRRAKLPDPMQVANNGSFFANPVVNEEKLQQLLRQYPEMEYWDTAAGHYKLSAAWLIERAGFKDYHDPETGMATWPTQPLVFINERAKSTADLLKFRQKIIDKMTEMYGLDFEQEPELIGD